MDGQFRSGVSLSSGVGSNSTGGADSENSSSQGEFAGWGLSILPDEMVVKVLSNLNFNDISTCRCVNHRWRELIDAHHLRPLSYCRRLHFRPIPQTVEHYHSFTKDWLTGFSNEGKELAGRLDTLLEHQNFSEILFFSTAELLSRVKSLTCQSVFTGYHSVPVDRASFSPNGRYLVAIPLRNHSVKIWELVGGQWQENATIGHSGFVNNASFSPDGSRLVTASGDGSAKIWELVAGVWQEMATLWHSSGVTNASFSPDKCHLATASLEGNAKIWKLVAGQWQEKFTVQHFTRVVTANFSPDGSHLVSASYDLTAKICGLDAAGQWQQKATIHHPGRVNNASFSPDGRFVVTASDDNNVIIYGLSDGQWQVHSTICHENPVFDARFSPDGRIITTYQYNSATIWRLVDGKWLEEADIEHSDWVIDVCFTPNGRLLATTSYDNTVKIWGHVAGQWQEKAIVSGFSEENPVYTASLSSDGSHLVTTFADETVIIWLLKSKGGEEDIS